MNAKTTALLGLFLAGLFLSRRANANGFYVQPDGSIVDDLEVSRLIEMMEPNDEWPGLNNPSAYVAPEIEAFMMPDDNLAAMLYVIRSSEHVYPRDVTGGRNAAAYSTFYGGSRFANMSDHPVITGEKRGVPLPDSFCIAAGFKPGCVSTAAGAYQIIKPTWQRVRAAGEWGPRLLDFSPESQDEAARRILIEAGAMPFIERADIVGALVKASKQWASLPGSTAKQGGKPLAFVLDRFNEYGVA